MPASSLAGAAGAAAATSDCPAASSAAGVVPSAGSSSAAGSCSASGAVSSNAAASAGCSSAAASARGVAASSSTASASACWHEGRRRNEREQQREHALRQRFFGFHIPRLLPFRGPGGQVGFGRGAPPPFAPRNADARRREQASLEHSLSTDPESNRNPFFSMRRSSCSNRALKLLSCASV